MTDESHSSGVSLSLPALERIETVCLAFEAVWKQGHKPQIEEYLGASQGTERSHLFRELLLLELDYLKSSGANPTLDEYQARFPQDSQLVSDVFKRLSTDAAMTDTSPSSTAPVPHQRDLPCQFGDYELLEVLGEGGMGIVYRARQQTPARVVALKIIRPDRLGPLASNRREQAIERFRAETQAAASLEHEHIVPVYEVGQFEGQPFFSMRYVEGRGLGEVLRDGPLAGRNAAALLESVARALHYAHGRDIVHRDMKPSNILLDSDRKPYVADFGLAKSFAAAQELTQTMETIGTPAYMSPEQARGPTGVDRRTDVYNLGATLYELLTGRPPFRAATVVETLRQVVENEPVSPRKLNPAIDRDLETICLKCLEKEPARRYNTAKELADELKRFQRREPIRARPVSRIERCWRWSRRNPWAALAVGLFLILAVGSPPVAYYQYRLTGVAKGQRDTIAKNAERAADDAFKIKQLYGEVSNSLNKTKVALTRATEAEGEAKQAQSVAETALYTTDMKLMETLWEKAQLRTMRTRLARHVPDAGEPDLRDFEWYYWQRQCNRQQQTLVHGQTVERMALTPDGKYLATAGAVEPSKQVIRIWEQATGKLVNTFAQSPIGVVAMRFVGDAPRLAIVLRSNVEQEWDWRTGKPLSSRPPDHEFSGTGYKSSDLREAYALAQSGQFYAASNGNRVILRSAGETRHGNFQGVVPGIVRRRTANRLTDAPDTLTASAADMQRFGVKVWDPSDELAPPPQEDGGSVFALALSPDETLLGAGSRHGEVVVWSLVSGAELWRVTAHENIIWDLAFSPDGKLLATGSQDGLIKLWELPSGNQRAVIAGHRGAVRAVAFSNTGVLASGGDDRTVRIWSTFSGGPVEVWLGHEQAVTDVEFAPDGGSVLSAGWDGTVKQWPVRNDDRPLLIANPSPLDCLDLFPDGRHVAATGLTGEVTIWDVGTGEITATLQGQPEHAFHLRVGAGDESVVAGTWDGTFTKWDIASGRRYPPRYLSLSRTVFSMPQFAISTDGCFVAGQCDDRKVRIVGMQSDSKETVLPGEMWASRVLFSPDGQQLLTVGHQVEEGGKASAKADIKLWDSATGELTTDVATGVLASTAAFSPDGRWLGWCPRTSSDAKDPVDAEIVIWDTASKEISQRLPIPADVPYVGTLVFSQDGTLLAATAVGPPKGQQDRDRVLLVWERASARLLHRLPGFPDCGRAIEFTPDGSEVAVAGADGCVRFWNVATGVKMRELARPSGPVVNAVFSPDGCKLGVLSNSAGSGSHGATMFRTIVSLDGDGQQDSKMAEVGTGPTKWSWIALADGSFVPSGTLWQRFELKQADVVRYGLSGIFSRREAYAHQAKLLFVRTSAGYLLRGPVAGGGRVAVAKSVITNNEACTAIAAAPDGRWVALAVDQKIQLWDGRQMKLAYTLEGHEDYIRSLAFSGDGSRLASGSSDRTIRLWSTNDGALMAVLVGHGQSVTCVSFTKTDRTVASSSRDGTIQLWDVETGESKTTLSGHVGPVHWIEFSPDGNTLASCGEDGTVRLWKCAADDENQAMVRP